MDRPGTIPAAVALLWIQIISSAAVLAFMFNVVFEVHVVSGGQYVLLFAAVAFGLLVLQGFLAIRIAKGENWARLGGVVFSMVAGIVTILLSIPAEIPALCLSYTGLSIIIVTLLLMPTSAAWCQGTQRPDAPLL